MLSGPSELSGLSGLSVVNSSWCGVFGGRVVTGRRTETVDDGVSEFDAGAGNDDAFNDRGHLIVGQEIVGQLMVGQEDGSCGKRIVVTFWIFCITCNGFK